MPAPHGQIIRLKPGAEEAYVILHKNAFPAVLSRIARSNIANYGIYLYDQLLFGYYEYNGNDYQADLSAMSEDISTQEWWKLTAPLQEPLPEHSQQEWWTELNLVFQYQNSDALNKPLKRFVYVVPSAGIQPDNGTFEREIRQDKILLQGIKKILCFQGHGNAFIYHELEEKIPGGTMLSFLKKLTGLNGDLVEMKEVFHTEREPKQDKKKKVFVTGCFDMLHSGHIEFLREASFFGDLFVCIGSDANVCQLKGRSPVNTQEERKYMLSSVRYVHKCLINNGWGIIDFMDEIEEIMPDIFIVNEDGNTPAKASLCERLGIEYKVLKRIPHAGLPVRSTTSLLRECRIPYRIDLAGGWLDQPFVSQYYPGPVLTISIEPTLEFNDRSGMASSTRRKAIELWKTDIPPGNPEQLASLLFSYDNPPGNRDISGSQDSLGIVLPGLNKLFYSGGYWPEKITSVHQEDILSWLENHLHLVTLGPRQNNYKVVENKFITAEHAKKLSLAAEKCWDAILLKDIRAFGKAFRDAFEAQVSMFPNMVDENIRNIIEQYNDRAYGWKLSGAGGGGYLILVTDVPIDGIIRIKIRRKEGI